MAKTLQSAVETLERDKAQLQDRVHTLEQRLMGTQSSEGEFREAPGSGKQTLRLNDVCSEHPFCTDMETCSHEIPDKLKFSCLFFYLCCGYAGDAALEQLREEKDFAEGQVRLAGVLLLYI